MWSGGLTLGREALLGIAGSLSLQPRYTGLRVHRPSSRRPGFILEPILVSEIAPQLSWVLCVPPIGVGSVGSVRRPVVSSSSRRKRFPCWLGHVNIIAAPEHTFALHPLSLPLYANQDLRSSCPVSMLFLPFLPPPPPLQKIPVSSSRSGLLLSEMTMTMNPTSQAPDGG